MVNALKKAVPSSGVQKVYEQRCQAHTTVFGRNPTPEQKAKFKEAVVHEAKKLNRAGGF